MSPSYDLVDLDDQMIIFALQPRLAVNDLVKIKLLDIILGSLNWPIVKIKKERS